MDRFQKSLLEEARAHREFLHSSLRITAWVIGAVAVVLVPLTLFTLGDSASAAASSAASRALDEEKGRERFRNIVDAAAQEAEADVPERMEKRVPEAFAASEAEISRLFAEKLKTIQSQSIDDIVREEARKASIAVPVGSLIAWAGSAAQPPPGWQVCNGDLLSKSAPEWLRNALVDGRVPDLSGRGLIGSGGEAGIDLLKQGGVAATTISLDAHTHASGTLDTAVPTRFLDKEAKHSPDARVPGRFVYDVFGQQVRGARHDHGIVGSTSPSGGFEGEYSNIPPSLGVTWIMRIY